MGQSLAILGRGQEAEEMFAQALDFFRNADLPEGLKSGEIEQTSIYRCINAFDTALVNRHQIFTELFGNTQKIQQWLTNPGVAKTPYGLHLFLRTIYWHMGNDNLDLTPLFDVESGTFHPWELINLYRALLGYKTGQRCDEWYKFISESFRLCALPHHGATLNLIGCFVYAVSRCLLNKPPGNVFKEQLKLTEKCLPAAGKVIHPLRNFRAEPGSVNTILQFLPFNYR